MTTFLTVEELATRVHKSPRTIQRWARERLIPHVKLGRATLFTEDQVAEIASAYTREPQERVADVDLPNPGFSQRRPVVVPMRRPGDAA
jgi:excisionase family DNA binding protein